ncbi:glycoside hydrolase family 5 protein [Patulibacter minatonensis]|uniref:glycoside hydrolase family 5 protein n=1 Tax=Patulibacter minatonensis TaxID=298163 RepID=UPI00047C31B2|nr:cellulase family glycosylhydrolase [Patulibacter minatonensis]
MSRPARLVAALAFVVLLVTAGPAGAATPSAPEPRVESGRLVDASRTDRAPLQLRGVNRSGTEFACSKPITTPADPTVPGSTATTVNGFSIFDGPSYAAANVTQPESMLTAMESWGINAVRIPLSESCWFGRPGLQTRFSGAAYQTAIAQYVDQLKAHGIVAILSLHVASTSASPNFDGTLWPLPAAQGAPIFWSQVADRFRLRTNVVFDAYNEPFIDETLTTGGAFDARHSDDIGDDGVRDTDAQRWACWRNGCLLDPADPADPPADPASTDPPPTSTPTPAYQAAGMQQLVTSIRQAGAHQPILLGGLGYASTFVSGASGWLSSLPTDPDGGLVASFHAYAPPQTRCAYETCWNQQVAPILAAGHPVVTGEIGQFDCAGAYVERYMTWADAQGPRSGARGGISYLAWTWNETKPVGRLPSWNCSTSPAVIEDYGGTPTATYGTVVRRHLLDRAAAEAYVAPAPIDPGPPVTTTAAPPATVTAPPATTAPPAATTPVPTTPRTMPARTVAVSAKALRLKGGSVAATVSCPKGSTPCAGSVRVRTATRATLGRRRGTFVVLSTTYAVEAGRTATLHVRPTSDGRALLRRTRRLTVVATATSDGAGPRTRRLALTR